VDYVTGWTNGDADLVGATQTRVLTTTAARLLTALDPDLAGDDGDSAGADGDSVDDETVVTAGGGGPGDRAPQPARRPGAGRSGRCRRAP